MDRVSGEARSDYKPVPTELLKEVFSRPPAPGVDPMLHAYQKVFHRYGVARSGVIHIGGHVGQELPLYAALGFERVVMVEPLDAEFAVLTARVAAFNRSCALVAEMVDQPPALAQAMQFAVSDQEGLASFYRTRLTSLSSLSRPVPEAFASYWREMQHQLPWYKRPLLWWKTRAATNFEEVRVRCITLDQLVKQLPHGWSGEDFTYLRLNIQGAELRALSGGRTLLHQVALIDIETNIDGRYEGAPDKRDFDRLLVPFGFEAAIGYRIGTMGNLVYVRSAMKGKGGRDRQVDASTAVAKSTLQEAQPLVGAGEIMP